MVHLIGWLCFVDSDLAHFLSQFIQYPIGAPRTRQKVEQPKYKSTQHSYPTTWTTLYERALSRVPPSLSLSHLEEVD